MRQTAEVKETDFQASNAEQVIKKYTPLINKLAYQLYSRYSSVIDFNDAKQEITMCMYQCLLRYNPGKASFVAYFRSAVNQKMSRFYYSYFHAININQNIVEVKDSDDEESNRPSFDWLVNRNNESNPRRLRPLLSHDSQKLYDLFMKEGKISRWLIAKKLRLSRCYAQQRYDSFKRELAEVTKTAI